MKYKLRIITPTKTYETIETNRESGESIEDVTKDLEKLMSESETLTFYTTQGPVIIQPDKCQIEILEVL